jgi:hypothetical protein
MSLDPISAGLDLGTELLKFLNNVSKFFPDYKQKKLEEYHYHHDRYVNELKMEPTLRDDGRIDYHRTCMVTILSDFSTYLEVKQKEKRDA